MWSRAALALLAVGLAAGCTSTSEGTPSPETTETIPVSPPTTSLEETPEFPPRPQDIPLDDLNPCEVWTPEQRTQLGLRDKPATGSPSESPIGGGLDCYWYTPREVEPEFVYTVITNPELDITNLWGDDTSRITEDVTDVGGFPAIREAGAPGMGFCGYHVGVADGQVLSFDLSIFPANFSVEEHCKFVLSAAELAIESLR